MAFIIFVLAIFIFILYNNFNNLKRDFNFIKNVYNKHSEEILDLKKEIADLKRSVIRKIIIPESNEIKAESEIKEIQLEENISIHNSTEKQTFKVEDAIQQTPIIEIPELEKPIFTFESKTEPRFEKQIAIEKEVFEESAFSKFIKKAEKQFADNWTGILGTAIMVLGIGYLSIYTALKVTPIFRVLIIWLYAGLLIGSYYILKKKEKWVTTGLWLRSAGASLFLFGCYGASVIPTLTFIPNPIAGYSLIGLGIGLNLFVGYIIKKQTFLSLHVILSMLVLCVTPEKTLATFILATITIIIGIILSYKEKWEYHLLLVIIAFIIFDIWFNVQRTNLSSTENIIAILGIIAVAGSCMFMQYRKVYDNSFFDKSGFITHLTNWVLFALGLILHSTGSKFKTFVLFGGAIICLIIAIRARKKKIYWLYHLDGMVSFILLTLSVIMLNDWNVGIDIIACILYALVIVCLLVFYKSKELLLHQIFLVINHFIVLALFLFLGLLNSNFSPLANITNTMASTIILSVIAISVPIYSSIKKELELVDSFVGVENLSINGLSATVFSTFIIILSKTILNHNLFLAVLFGIAIFWCLLKQKFNNRTFDIGRIIFYFLSIILSLYCIQNQEKSYFDFVFSAGLLIILILNWKEKLFYENEFMIRFLAIVSANALLFVLVYKFLPQHQIIQIFSLFGVALLNHEFLWLNRNKNNITTNNQITLYVFYYLFIVIGNFLFLKHIPNFSSIEIGLTCLGISTIEIYVLLAKRIRNISKAITVEWSDFHRLNSEFILLNILLFGFSCIQHAYISVYLGVFSVLFFLSFQKFEELKRFNEYSFFLLVGSIILSLYSSLNNIDNIEKTTLYLTQIASILISIGYYSLVFKSKDEIQKRFLTSIPYLQNLWIILLLFIQVEVCYLPILFMVLALINFKLNANSKTNIDLNFVTLISFLSLIVSLFYSYDKQNSFTIVDWILQIVSIALGIVLAFLFKKREEKESVKFNSQIVLNVWLSLIMFSQLEHKWLPIYWALTAILNLYLYHRKISQEKNISIVYYLLANLHLGFLSFNYYESEFLFIYLFLFTVLAVYIYLSYKWMEEFKLKNSLLIYPATLSIGFFLYLTFNKGILTFFWILEALALLILGIVNKEKYFRYVSLSLVGLCVVRLMFFDLSNADLLIRALVLLGVGIVLLVMNSLFKKYKDRFD